VISIGENSINRRPKSASAKVRNCVPYPSLTRRMASTAYADSGDGLRQGFRISNSGEYHFHDFAHKLSPLKPNFPKIHHYCCATYVTDQFRRCSRPNGTPGASYSLVYPLICPPPILRRYPLLSVKSLETTRRSVFSRSVECSGDTLNNMKSGPEIQVQEFKRPLAPE